MKWLREVGIGVLCSLYFLGASAQSIVGNEYKFRRIEPLRLAIATNMTTNLIFPYEIRSVDRGNGLILAQKAGGSENVLQIKAAKEDFRESNLSVITADGQLFSFLLVYAEYPSFLNLAFYKDSTDGKVKLQGTELRQDELQQTAAAVLDAKSSIRRSAKNQLIRLSLQNIFYHQQTMWFSFSLRNTSLINFHPEFIKFFVKHRKQSKRTAVQERELQPIYISSPGAVPGDQDGKLIIAFPAFTLAKNQELRILVKEKNGGRDLELRLRPASLMKAKLL